MKPVFFGQFIVCFINKILLEEKGEDSKDPGETKNTEYSDVDDEVGLAAVLVLNRLHHRGDVVDAGEDHLQDNNQG